MKKNSLKIVYFIFSFSIILLILNLFTGFPFSQLNYLFGYTKTSFPYTICEEDTVCEVKIGELFAHRWFYEEKECLSSVSAGYSYRDNYKYSQNIQDTGKKAIIKLPRKNWVLNCPMEQYKLFEAIDSSDEHYFSVDHKCIHSNCKEKLIKSPVIIIY